MAFSANAIAWGFSASICLNFSTFLHDFLILYFKIGELAQNMPLNSKNVVNVMVKSSKLQY